MKSANYFLGISLLLMILFLFSCNKQPSSPAPALTVNDYSRAEQFLPWNTYNMVFGDEVAPKFLNDDKFWFRSRESHARFCLRHPRGLRMGRSRWRLRFRGVYMFLS